MSEDTAILQELRALRVEQAEQFRLLRNKLSSLRWTVNRIYDAQENLIALLDDEPTTGDRPAPR